MMVDESGVNIEDGVWVIWTWTGIHGMKKLMLTPYQSTPVYEYGGVLLQK